VVEQLTVVQYPNPSAVSDNPVNELQSNNLLARSSNHHVL